MLITASDRTRAAADRLPALAEHAGLLGVLASEAAFTDADDWLDTVLIQLDTNRTLLGGTNYGLRSGAGHVRLNFGTSAELVGEMVRRMADTTRLPR